MKSSNPAFARVREALHEGEERMTVQGTINKSLMLFVLLLSTAIVSFFAIMTGAAGFELVLTGAIGGLVMGLYTTFNPASAYWSAPVYALFEGLWLGAVSAYYAAEFGAIILPALTLTLGVLGVMLLLYKTGVIRVTNKLRFGIVAAVGGVVVLLLVNFLFSVLMGFSFLHMDTPIILGINVVILIVAAFCLVLDFDEIEQASSSGAPKEMEWYSAFGLMLTLVWLYLTILRIMSILSRD